jgi:drug/metabolite transporter (DMT)-like permease
LTPLSIFLVLLSAFIHSSWNFIAKRGNWPLEFFFWGFLWGALLYLPFLAVLGYFPVFLSQLSFKAFAISLTSGFIQTVYFICLIKAYRMADLSLVYPISRSAPLFTQIWAFLFIGEIVSLQGIVGIGLVVLGIFVTSVREFHLKRVIPSFHAFPRSYFLALAAALAGSVYVVFDKAGVQILHPLVFGFLINLWMCTFIGLYTWRYRETSLLKVWHESKKDIIIIAFLQNAGYILILWALQMSKVSYVISFRQAGVLSGALMGILFLKESHWKTRLTGAMILTLGLVLIGLAK